MIDFTPKQARQIIVLIEGGPGSGPRGGTGGGGAKSGVSPQEKYIARRNAGALKRVGASRLKAYKADLFNRAQKGDKGAAKALKILGSPI